MNGLSPQILIQLSVSLISVILYFIVIYITKSIVLKYGYKQKFIEQRIIYIKKFFSIIFSLTLLIVLAITWGIDFKGILILASSFFAIVGIALFASWSILSNITSSVILFFSFPYKIGDRIRIIDGDNSVEGILEDITMFSMQIKDDLENIIFYPNSLAMQKPVKKMDQPVKNG